MQVDPSCSGSGIVSRFDSLLESGISILILLLK